MPPSTRAKKALEVAKKEIVTQIPELCFNIQGHAYEHGIADRELNATVVSFSVSSKAYAT
jgi:hypothetical protein